MVSPFRIAPALAAVLALLLSARAARAHREPLPLPIWGGFGMTAARCQRALGSAATQCGLAVLAARQNCIDAELAGTECDADAAEGAVGEARGRALEKAAAYCSDVDATHLQFLGTAEALADLTRVCRELETALVTAAYGPALRDTVVLPVDAPTRACLVGAARGAARVLRYTARAQRTPLDHLAAQALTLEEKQERLAHAAAQLAARHPAFTALVAAACPQSTFASLYGRGIDAFVADVASRAACLAGAVYVQDAVLCPPARCGNGMEEPLEECDDGNADGSDWCRSDCTLSEKSRRSLVVGPHPSD